MKPLVSIVIPYFNRPVKLERCLASIFSQTYDNYEIIVVDDCSEVPYQVDNDKVQYLRNEKNSGPGVSRNVGMARASGDYIAFLDSDDYWHPDFLKTLLAALQNNQEAIMVYAQGYGVDSNGEFVKKRRKKTFFPTVILPNVLYRGRSWGTGGCLWNRKLIKDVKWLPTRNWEDYAFDISVGLNNNNIIPVEENLVYYDVSGEDKLSKRDKSFSLIEKNKSLNIISNRLLESKNFNSPDIKRHITVLILVNLVKLLRENANDKKCLGRSFRSLNKWRNPIFAGYVFLGYYFPQKFAVKLLMRLKRSVNKGKFTYLG